ncbi:C45 family autoproteolytic acyltransferase/hydolase [Roseovarius spongiae]|uniref:C45 family autoproteolytic acyltransferase/hydolase n=1 Tax=Roseovarius spongiae TaxID=2320272 RepID=UPI00140B2927|nr:C45 family peptidase [Roseovarius spongiae]
MKPIELSFRSLSESAVGNVWKQVFGHGWPGWKAWYLGRLGDEPAPVEKCRRMLRDFMPGMEHSWDAWVSSVGGDEDVARFLSFWTPPRYLVNCSQAAGVDAQGPWLIRNYDLDPMLNETTLLRSAWRGYRVMGMVEGMAGLSDGMNEAGLALSLSFGGRIERGRGFGIPLIMRYVLETCRDCQDALDALRGIPCHMSYNVTAIDRAGRVENLMLAPDRPLIRRDDCWATNHQLGVEWPHHGRLTGTVERGARLDDLLKGETSGADAMLRAFLAPPLFSTGYDRGFGTVYTALYRPATGSVTLAWADGERHVWRLDDFPARALDVTYRAAGSAACAADAPARPFSGEDRRLHAIAARNTLERREGWTNINPLPDSRTETGETA